MNAVHILTKLLFAGVGVRPVHGEMSRGQQHTLSSVRTRQPVSRHVKSLGFKQSVCWVMVQMSLAQVSQSPLQIMVGGILAVTSEWWPSVP